MRPDVPEIDFSQLPLTHTQSIPESYRDEMGHMNVTWYTHLFSEAMGGMMTQLGLSMEYVAKEKIGGVALEAHIHYLAEVHIGNTVSVFTRMLARSDKRLHMLHILRNDTTGHVASLFEGIMACFDLRQRRMTTVPDNIATILDGVLAEHNQLEWTPPLTGVMKP